MKKDRIIALAMLFALMLAVLAGALPGGAARAVNTDLPFGRILTDESETTADVPSSGTGSSSGSTGAADSGLPYRIEVDISSQIVTVYMAGTDQIVRQMLCSSGKNDATPLGDFILPKTRSYTDRLPWYRIGNVWVKYATRIYGSILFHSVLYTRPSMHRINEKEMSRFGYPASHGCIRLKWQDAQFIAENCMDGTPVRIYKSGKRRESLRQLLFQESFDASQGYSYESYLGISDDPTALSRGDEEEAVLDLQYRLRDLGIYDGEMTGAYDSPTVNAVRNAQYLLGDVMTGIATAEFRQKIYSSDAPAAMNVELTEGMGGPAVRKLQENLQALRLYDDALDSVYDVGVTEAVKSFQMAYCYEVNGVAGTEVQKAIDYEAGKVRETFGDSAFSLEMITDEMQLARVTATMSVAMRRGASPQFKKVKTLHKDQLLIVVKKGRGWSQVRVDGVEGYVKNDLLRFFSQKLYLLRYTSEEDGRVYTVGSSSGDYYAGASLPCDVFAEYLAANDQSSDIGSLAHYVTVDTKGQALSLNLRESPSADSTVLGTVENGTSLLVENQFAEWTQVNVGGRVGYLLNDYLNFWMGPDDALEVDVSDEAITADMINYAVVESAVETGAGVYADDSDDAGLLGHLADGIKVEVVDIEDSWCLIRYKGHEGYMSAENLQLVLKNDPGAEADEHIDEIGDGNIDGNIEVNADT